MPKSRVLSGKEVAQIFVSFGFETVSQRGSHVKLKRIRPGGSKQTLTIPNHEELDRGTLHAIYRQALHYISEEELADHFYTE